MQQLAVSSPSGLVSSESSDLRLGGGALRLPRLGFLAGGSRDSSRRLAAGREAATGARFLLLVDLLTAWSSLPGAATGILATAGGVALLEARRRALGGSAATNGLVAVATEPPKARELPGGILEGGPAAGGSGERDELDWNNAPCGEPKTVGVEVEKESVG